MSLDTADTIASADVPRLGARRLLYIATGGIQAMFTPMWLNLLHTRYPEVDVTSVVTRSALRFTTPTALGAAGGAARHLVDEWGDSPTSAMHVDLAQWPDAVLVHPATMSFVARMAQGLGDTPALLALQCTSAPIALCPGLPPGGHRNHAYRRNIGSLAEWPNVTVLPPTSGTSMSTGEQGLGTAAYFPTALQALEELRQWMVHNDD